MSNTNCWVTFANNDDMGGSQTTYENPGRIDDLESHKRDFNSLKTGSQCWVQIFDETNCSGQSIIIGPNEDSVNLDGITKEGSGHGWQNEAESIILYDYDPTPNPTTQPVIDRFGQIFDYCTNLKVDVEGSNTFQFITQDGTFYITNPVIKIQNGNSNLWDFTLELAHRIDSNDVDSAEVLFTMDTTTGRLAAGTTIQVTYNYASATEVPQWAIKMADLAIDGTEVALKLVVDSCEETITEGLGTLAVPAINKVIGYGADALTFVVDHINVIFTQIFRLEEDGCTLYFSSVVAQSIYRSMRAFVENCVNTQTLDTAGATIPGTITMRMNNIPTATGLDLNTSGWETANSGNEYFECDYGDDNYRVWYPDETAGYGGTGYLCSVKLDNILDPSKDDHCVLNVFYDPQGNVAGIQAGILFHKNTGDDYIPPNSGLIAWSTNSAGKAVLVQVTQDPDTGHTASKELPGSDIVSAYVDCFNASFDESKDDVNYDGGTLAFPSFTTKIIDAMKKSLNIPVDVQ